MSLFSPGVPVETIDLIKEIIEECNPNLVGKEWHVDLEAGRIVEAYLHHQTNLGRSSEVKAVEKIVRCLGQAHMLLDELPQGAKNRIAGYIEPDASEPLISESDTIDFDLQDKLFAKRLAVVKSFREAVDTYHRRKLKGTTAPLKMKTQAASVAAACRYTWVRGNGADKTPDRLEHNAPGPMGRFIQRIFDALDVDGNPARALEAFDKQHKINEISKLERPPSG